MSTWQKLGTSVAVTVSVFVTCLCWSLGHGEQLLFSCVSSKVSIWVILARLEQLGFFSSEVWYSHRTSWKRPKNWSRLVPESGEDSASSLLFDKFVVFLQQSIIIGKIRNFEPIFMLCMIFFSLLLVLWLQFDFLDIFLGFETSRYILEWSPNANCFQKI